jgi:hypothetical protein
VSVIQFDIDGVLADFLGGYHNVQDWLGMVRTESTNWDDYYSAEVWAEIKSYPYFWEDLGACVPESVFRRINALQPHTPVYFVTNRAGWIVKTQTENWLKARGVLHPTVVVTTRKGEFAHAVGATHAIDDKAGNAVYTTYQSPKTVSYLLDRPYNRFDQSVLGTKVKRIGSVTEFLDDIEAA